MFELSVYVSKCLRKFIVACYSYSRPVTEIKIQREKNALLPNVQIIKVVRDRCLG